MAPRPKNQKLAAIDGSAKKHPERVREIIPVDDDCPPKPSIIEGDKMSSDLWDDTVKKLQSMGLICTQDAHLLTAYVLNYRQLLLCAKDLQDNGDTSITRDGGQKASGSATNYQRYAQLHVKLMSELGLTPSARASLAKPVDRSQDSDDEVADLLARLGSGP